MGWSGAKGAPKGTSKGGDKGAYASAPKKAPQADDEELIWNAVTEAVAPILPYETELDPNKLEKRMRDCFKKGTKGLNMTNKPWYDLINEYADTVFAAIWNSLGDKEWLPQCDFLLCLDAGIKDSFPKHTMARIPQIEFERVCLAAHDRAHEEQRVSPLMWQACSDMIDGPKGKKKVNTALEEGWKEARHVVQGDASDVQNFVACWIDRTIAGLSAASQGEPQWVMEPEIAVTLFDCLLQRGAMLMSLVEAHGPPPPGWRFINHTVDQAYAAHVVMQDGAEYGGSKKKRPGGGGVGGGKGGAKGGKGGAPRQVNPLLADVPAGQCRDFLLGRCSRGDECKFDHDDVVKAEVDLKRALQEADDEDEAEAKRSRLA